MREAAVWLGLLLAATSTFATTTGTVTTLDGTPLAGAQIHAYAPESQTEERRRLLTGDDRAPLASATSDETGRFDLSVADDRVLQIVVELGGHAPWAQEVVAGNQLGALLLQPAPLARGSVRADHQPLAGARVVWADKRGRPLWVTETDERGSYRVPDPGRWAGSVTVLHRQIAAYQHSPQFGVLTLREPWHRDDSLPLALAPRRGRSLSGRVVAGGEPVAGAEIEAAGWPLTTSDDDGRFTVRVLKNAVLQARLGARLGRAAVAADDGADDGEVTIELAEPRSLRVTVEDQGGRGLAGAGVHLFAQTEPPFLGRYVTDRDGRVSAGGLPAAKLTLWVEAPDLRVEDHYQEIDLSRRREAEVKLVTRPSTRLRGRVVNAGGQSVAGALVVPGVRGVLYGLPNGLQQAARSGDDGGFEMPLPAGKTASLVVLAQGRAAQTFELAATGRDLAEPVEIRLPAGVAAAFSVTDGSGEPIADVSVAIVEGLSRSGHSALELVAQGDVAWLYRTDHAGQVRARLRPGVHSLGFHAEGFAPAEVARYHARAGAGLETVVLHLGAEIEGRVVTTSGKPAGAVVVMAQGEAIGSHSQTTAGGHFRFEDLPAGPYVLTAEALNGLAPAVMTVEAPARGVTLRLDDGVELSGLVLDRSTGLPIAAANVSAKVAGTHDDRSSILPAMTGDGGRFTLQGLRAGRVALRVTAEGFLDGAAVEIEIEPAEVRPEVELELEPGATLSGRVTDDRGEPVAEVRVEIREPQVRKGATDTSGEYLLRGVAPGDLEVAFTSADFLDRSESVELTAAGARLDVELEPGQILRGAVRELAGGALENARIRGTRRGHRGSKWARSDAAGSFELRGLAPGEWQLAVSKTGFVEQQLTRVVPAGEGVLEVILEPVATGTLIGTVRGAQRAELATLNVSVWSRGASARAEVEAGGSYRVEEAPAGDVTVRLLVSAGENEKSLVRRAVVPKGGRARVDFDLEQAPLIRGRVVRGEDPVMAARVQLERIGSADEASTRTGGGGWFEVEIEEGSYEVSVWTMDGSQHHERRQINATSILEIDVAPAGLEGRVLDAVTGKGLAGAVVELRPRVRRQEWSSYDLPEVTTDSRGRFAVAGAPIGRFMLSARAAEYAPQLLEVALEGGTLESVEIVLEPAEGLDVVLFDARSGAVLRGDVVARLPSDAVIWDGKAPRSGDGVRLPLGPGDYKVSVSANGYASQTLLARVPSREPLRVALTPGGTVVVRSQTLERRIAKLIAPDGEEYVRCWCNKISAFKIEGSETVLEHIAPGGYTLMIQDPDGSSQALPLQVLEGLSVEVAVR